MPSDAERRSAMPSDAERRSAMLSDAVPLSPTMLSRLPPTTPPPTQRTPSLRGRSSARVRLPCPQLRFLSLERLRSPALLPCSPARPLAPTSLDRTHHGCTSVQFETALLLTSCDNSLLRDAIASKVKEPIARIAPRREHETVSVVLSAWPVLPLVGGWVGFTFLEPLSAFQNSLRCGGGGRVRRLRREGRGVRKNKSKWTGGACGDRRATGGEVCAGGR
jgi:hypothetical protein